MIIHVIWIAIKSNYFTVIHVIKNWQEEINLPVLMP